MTPKGDTGTGTRARGNGRALPRTPVTLADVAREAGVSVATASFVLSGRAGSRSSGSPETKAKVRAAAEALHYVPNRTAQAMRTGRGGGVVLALGTLADPWGVSLARQVRSDALPHELSTLILADERWYEYLQGASADSAFITSVDFGADGPEKVRRLLSLCERTKRDLTALTKAEIDLEPLLPGRDVVLKLSRAKFEILCQDLLLKTIACVTAALTSAEVSETTHAYTLMSL